MTPRSLIATASALVVTGGLALAANALAPPAPLSIRSVSMEQRGPSVRVVVAFSGRGVTGRTDIEAVDARPADGRAVIRVISPGISSTVPVLVGASGTRVKVIDVGGRLRIQLTGRRERFKFVSYRADRSRRLVIDLWEASTREAARVVGDGCLRLTRYTGGRGRATAQGLELVPLFEHGLVLSLRRNGVASRTLGLVPVIAEEGTFKADFSGYRIPGRFSGSVPATVTKPTRVMLEAWSSSAKDGSLDCLAQVPITLTP